MPGQCANAAEHGPVGARDQDDDDGWYVAEDEGGQADQDRSRVEHQAGHEDEGIGHDQDADHADEEAVDHGADALVVSEQEEADFVDDAQGEEHLGVVGKLGQHGGVHKATSDVVVVQFFRLVQLFIRPPPPTTRWRSA